jgi:FHS family L-fucose permease-like MFS transporter
MEKSKNNKAGFLLPGYLLPFIMVTILFFMWGIPNNLNGVLIKQFMKSMEISRFQAGLIQSAFYLGYFVLAIPAGILMRRYSYKTGIICGLLLYSLGCMLFWPAAIIGKYGFFLFGLFVIASGLAFLETGANPFIAMMGNPDSSEQRLNFSQAFNPIGSVTGVLLGTIFIFSGIEPGQSEIASMKLSGQYGSFLQNETMRVVKPYIGLAIFALTWAILMMKVRFPKFDTELISENDSKGSFRDLLRFPNFWKGVLAQFFYVGAQVGTWSYFIPYVQDYTGQPEKVAGYFLTGTLVAFGVGRFSATWFMRYIRPNLLMGLYSSINVVLVALSILMPGWIGMWAIFLTSFFMSLMYPTIFAISIKDLGENTKIGGSVLVMAIIGGALCTPLMGYIAERTDSMAIAMTVPLVAYLYVAWYSFRGYKVTERSL